MNSSEIKTLLFATVILISGIGIMFKKMARQFVLSDNQAYLIGTVLIVYSLFIVYGLVKSRKNK